MCVCLTYPPKGVGPWLISPELLSGWCAVHTPFQGSPWRKGQMGKQGCAHHKHEALAGRVGRRNVWIESISCRKLQKRSKALHKNKAHSLIPKGNPLPHSHGHSSVNKEVPPSTSTPQYSLWADVWGCIPASQSALMTENPMADDWGVFLSSLHGSALPMAVCSVLSFLLPFLLFFKLVNKQTPSKQIKAKTSLTLLCSFILTSAV